MHKITPSHLRKRNSKKYPTATLFKFTISVAAVFAFQTACAACTATMDNINFGNIDLLNPGTLTAQAQLTVTCTRDSTGWNAWLFSEYTNVCLAVDSGRAPGWNNRNLNPRGLCPNGSCTNAAPLYYNLYTNTNHSTIWGTPNITDTPDTIQTTFTFPRNSTAAQSKTLTVYAKLNEPLTNVVPGTYSIDYTEGATALAYTSSTGSMPTSCGSMQAIRFPFTVSATMIKNCTVSKPSNIDFGEVSPTETNLQGQTSFNVRCTKDTPYTIGMKPSNENLNGAGFMESKRIGTANNGKIPYQLRSQSGINGRIWGNTATATSAGNGVSGTGTGFDHEHTVYATVPSADYHVGEYQDTVTIQVNY